MAWGDADKVVTPAVSWGANDTIVSKVGRLEDSVKGYAAGALKSVSGAADSVLKVLTTDPMSMATNYALRATMGSDAPQMLTPTEGMVNAGLKGIIGPKAPQITHSGQAVSDLTTGDGMDYTPTTRTGRFAKTLGENTINLIAPGSAPARIANVVIPSLTEEGAGQAAEALGFGRKGVAVARAGGAMVGGLAASMRPQNALRPADTPAGMMTDRAPQSAADLAQRAQGYRDVGINPTMTDVVDDAGRGVIRAAANRNTPARGAANDFADARALDLPSRIGAQARRTMSQDPRTPDEIRSAMAAQRSGNADTAFGAVRGDMVDLGHEGLTTLRVPEVVDAIGEATRRERDPQVRDALDQLSAWAGGPHSTGAAPPITIGMADRISRVLLSKARATPDADLRATLTQFGEAIRSPARDASPGYASALEGYGADSRLHAAAGVGEGLMTRNTDEFTQAARGLSDPERQMALASGRRAIERKAGETIGSAPGIARSLADAPEQQARNAALMGPDRANDLQSGMRMEAQAVGNARMIQPKAGSPTHLNDADSAALADRAGAVVRVGRQAATHDWLGMGMDWLRSRGMSDADAEALVRMSIDPARTDEAIRLVAQHAGQAGARQFLQMRNAALLGGVAASTASPALAASSQDQPRR